MSKSHRNNVNSPWRKGRHVATAPDPAPMTDQQLREAIANTKTEYERLPIGLEREEAHKRHIALVSEQMERKARKAA